MTSSHLLLRAAFVLLLGLGLLRPQRLDAQTNLILSEFMSANTATLTDEDGDFSDWIEIYNPTTNTVNLGGWYLTDNAARLTKWSFPVTNLPPNGYLIVFASNKDRRVAGRTLHTNFRLDDTGEYLALVLPDGVTKAFDYPAPFAVQVPGVSFGVPVTTVASLLVSNGAALRWTVPLTDMMGTAWRDEGFNDSGWFAGTNGLGYETDGPMPFSPVVLGNSVSDFSGTQGQSNWFYGYWNKRADADGVYAAAEFTPFPRGGGAFSATNLWDGTKWDWFAGNPPWIEISSTGGHPSGDQGVAQPIHWRFAGSSRRRTGRCASAASWRIRARRAMARSAVSWWMARRFISGRCSM